MSVLASTTTPSARLRSWAWSGSSPRSSSTAGRSSCSPPRRHTTVSWSCSPSPTRRPGGGRGRGGRRRDSKSGAGGEEESCDGMAARCLAINPLFVYRRGKIIFRTVGGTNLTNYEVGCRNKKTRLGNKLFSCVIEVYILHRNTNFSQSKVGFKTTLGI